MKKRRKAPKVWSKSEVCQISAGDAEAFRKMLGPGALDQSVRHALQLCWMLLPGPLRTAENVEREFRQIVDRAIRDLREDRDRFMFSPPGTEGQQG